MKTKYPFLSYVQEWAYPDWEYIVLETITTRLTTLLKVLIVHTPDWSNRTGTITYVDLSYVKKINKKCQSKDLIKLLTHMFK